MPPGHFIFKTWSTIPILTRAVTESSRYHSCNQEHNPGYYERSQRVDRAVFESRVTRTVNRNPLVYKTSIGTSLVTDIFWDRRSS